MIYLFEIKFSATDVWQKSDFIAKMEHYALYQFHFINKIILNIHHFLKSKTN
jgi:hypothetical protein